MLARISAILACAMLTGNGAAAAECRLDHATYRETVSGVVIEFRPKDPTKDANLTSAVFAMRLPNLADPFAGDVTWNAGSNARPDGEVGRQCSADESGEEACWLWTGNVYSLGDATAGLLGDADMMAPKAILFSDFGRSLATDQAFATANPDLAAFDVFTLIGCEN
jgi:hypothetical protein